MRDQAHTALTTIEECPSQQPVYPRSPYPPYDPVCHLTPPIVTDFTTTSVYRASYPSPTSESDYLPLSSSDDESDIVEAEEDDPEDSLDLGDCPDGLLS